MTLHLKDHSSSQAVAQLLGPWACEWKCLSLRCNKIKKRKKNDAFFYLIIIWFCILKETIKTRNFYAPIQFRFKICTYPKREIFSCRFLCENNLITTCSCSNKQTPCFNHPLLILLQLGCLRRRLSYLSNIEMQKGQIKPCTSPFFHIGMFGLDWWVTLNFIELNWVGLNWLVEQQQ